MIENETRKSEQQQQRSIFVDQQETSNASPDGIRAKDPGVQGLVRVAVVTKRLGGK